MGPPGDTRLGTADSISDFLSAWLEQEWLAQPQQGVLSEYYRSYVQHFGAYLRFHYRNQTVEMLECLRRYENPRVLEVGCGCGTESLYFALNGAQVLGIDMREDRVDVARSRKDLLEKLLNRQLDCQFQARSLFDVPPDHGFDIVWMEQAFHHIEPRLEAVRRIEKLLRPGGYLVISEANAWNPILQLALLKKRGFKTLSEYTDASGKRHVYGNERITTPLALNALLRKCGLEPLSLRYFRLFPNWPVADRLLWVERFVPKFLKFPFTHYNIVARKPVA